MTKDITMGLKASFRSVAHHSLPWLVLAVVPVAVNLLLWKIAVIPARAESAASRELVSLVQTKPQLEALIAQSDRLLWDWEHEASVTEDTASAEKWMQTLAKTQGVKIEEIVKKESESSAAKWMPLELKVTGGYFKLVHWLNAIEENPNIQTDYCLLAPPSVPGAGNQLNITVRVFSKNL